MRIRFQNICFSAMICSAVLLQDCTLKVKHEIISPSNDLQPASFDNMAIINKDSCEKWTLPITSFVIEYPDNYQIEYNPDKTYYLRLRKYQGDSLITQEITVGKNKNIDNRESAFRWLEYIDSTLNATIESYKTSYIGKDTINNQGLYTLQATINFDTLKDPRFLGNYSTTTAIVFPENPNTNGVIVSFLQHENMELDTKEKIGQEALNIWQTFRFQQ